MDYQSVFITFLLEAIITHHHCVNEAIKYSFIAVQMWCQKFPILLLVQIWNPTWGRNTHLYREMDCIMTSYTVCVQTWRGIMSNSSLTPFTVHWHSFKTYRMTIYMEQGRYAKIVLGYTPLSSNPPKMVHGEHKIYQNKKNPNLTCCVWQDTKQVWYASVACDPSIVGVAVHRVSRNYVRVNQPLVAQWYNQHYKSIDLFDQHMAAYPVSRRTYCSWKHIFGSVFRYQL